MYKKLLIGIILVSILLVSGGCSDGITGNAMSNSTINSDSDSVEYLSGSDAPQKRAKSFGTGHERVCY